MPYGQPKPAKMPVDVWNYTQKVQQHRPHSSQKSSKTLIKCIAFIPADVVQHVIIAWFPETSGTGIADRSYSYLLCAVNFN
jgi:hypothetical protein